MKYSPWMSSISIHSFVVVLLPHFNNLTLGHQKATVLTFTFSRWFELHTELYFLSAKKQFHFSTLRFFRRCFFSRKKPFSLPRCNNLPGSILHHECSCTTFFSKMSQLTSSNQSFPRLRWSPWTRVGGGAVQTPNVPYIRRFSIPPPFAEI